MGGGRQVQERRDVCLHVADPHCCTVETNTHCLKQLYSKNPKQQEMIHSNLQMKIEFLNTEV